MSDRQHNKMLAALRNVARGTFERLARLDAWKNPVTGLGDPAYDKTVHGRVHFTAPLDDQTLSALFHSDDLAERMVSIVPSEMLREGFSVTTGDPGADEIIEDKVKALGLAEKLTDSIRWARCYGGAALLLGADDGRDAHRPLVPERARDLSYVYVVDRRYLWPLTWYTEFGHPKFGEPETYMVTAVGGSSNHTAVVHESRLVIFRGSPTGVHERAYLAGWDFSVLQRAYDVLRSFNTGWKAAETLLTDGNQAIFKMTGLAEAIGSNERDVLQQRVEAMNLFRSVTRALVIDADSNESFERQTAPLSGLSDTLHALMLRLSACVQIPVTILMGQSPAGMNATGDSDFRWFYTRIRAEQTTMLAPRIRQIVKVWLKSRAGREAIKKEPKTLGINFPALWTPSPLEQAQIDKTVADRDAAYVNAQVFLPDEIALARGRRGGMTDEVILTDDAIKAREAALKSDLERLEMGESDPADEDGVRGFGGPASQPGQAPSNQRPSDEPSEEGEDLDGGRFDATLRRFELHRDVDETGVSGTGIVADGCQFATGHVVLRWRGENASTTLFDSVEKMLGIHGHGGKTRVVWVDEENA